MLIFNYLRNLKIKMSSLLNLKYWLTPSLNREKWFKMWLFSDFFLLICCSRKRSKSLKRRNSLFVNNFWNCSWKTHILRENVSFVLSQRWMFFFKKDYPLIILSLDLLQSYEWVTTLDYKEICKVTTERLPFRAAILKRCSKKRFST